MNVWSLNWLLLYTCAYNVLGLCISVLFWYSYVCDNKFSSALVLRIYNLHKRIYLYMQWLEAMEKWPCGHCFTCYSMILHDDVLIENNKYGCIIMQNNGAMKIVNFMHVKQLKPAFCRLWMLGTRLIPVVTFQLPEPLHRWSNCNSNRLSTNRTQS